MTDSLVNQSGVLSYPISAPNWIEGQVLRARPTGHPYPLPLRRQVYRLAVGGTASDGNYVTTITHPDGTSIVVTTTRATTPATNANLATQHAADVLAATGRKGVILSAAVASSTNVDVTFKHAGRDYTIETSAPGSGTLVATERVDPAGETIKMGRAITLDSLDGRTAVRNMASADAAAAVLGFAGRFHSGGVRPYNPTAADVAQYVAGDMVSLLSDCEIVVRNVSGSAATIGAAPFVVVNAAGGDEVGQIRATDDGSNAVELSAAQCRWLTAAPAGGLGLLLVKF
jgi:hypothetical protein